MTQKIFEKAGTVSNATEDIARNDKICSSSLSL